MEATDILMELIIVHMLRLRSDEGDLKGAIFGSRWCRVSDACLNGNTQ